jgi:hypothetical protein
MAHRCGNSPLDAKGLRVRRKGSMPLWSGQSAPKPKPVGAKYLSQHKK